MKLPAVVDEEDEGMELWLAAGDVAAGDVGAVVDWAKAGAASTTASAAAVKVRFVMDESF
jgi:hypothetical protein